MFTNTRIRFVLGLAIVLAAFAIQAGPRPAAAATITVDTLADTVAADGECTLREAIQNANDATDGQPNADCAAGDPAGADQIVFTVDGTITLGGTGLDEITQALTIDGGGVVAVDGAEASGILRLSNAPLTLESLHLTRGSVPADGAAIYAIGGDLTIRNGQLTQNEAGTSGGAVYIAGANLAIENTEILDNTAGNEGGAIWIGGNASTITGSTIESGTAGSDGGCILSGGELALTSTTFSGCMAGGKGGAIANNGTLTITGGAVTRSTAATGGGGVYNPAATSLTATEVTFLLNSVTSGNGGAIEAVGGATLALTGTTFDENNASGHGGAIDLFTGSATIEDSAFYTNISQLRGGAIHNNAAMLTVQGSEFLENQSTTAEGGAIYSESMQGPPALTVNGTLFDGNHAVNSGGAIYNTLGVAEVSDCVFLNNEAGIEAMYINEDRGGAIANQSGELNVTGSRFETNVAHGDGGAVSNFAGELLVTTSHFEANMAGVSGGAIAHNTSPGFSRIISSTFIANTALDDGGAYFNDEFGGVQNSLFAGNTAGSDGGAIMTGDELIVTNSTLSGNTASEQGGGIWHDGTLLSLTNDTIYGNSATNGGGGLFDGSSAGVSITNIQNTIFAANLTGENCLFENNPGPATVAASLSDDDTCIDVPTIDDVLLGPLADNGGQSSTHALLEGSPAIDAGDQEICDAIALGNGLPPVIYDQRGEGYPRTADGDDDGEAICDIGAFEFEPGARLFRAFIPYAAKDGT